MKVGIYGGTFDPIHIGHLITAQMVKEERGLDRIIFVPANIAPHKPDNTSSSAKDRMNMLNIAIKDHPYFRISDFEINKGGLSYTIDTLRYFSNLFERIDLIIGFDNLKIFNTWKNPEEILKLCNLVVLKRNNAKEEEKDFDFAHFVNVPNIEISGTTIRNRANKGLPIDFFVPDEVLRYINKYNIYREKS